MTAALDRWGHVLFAVVFGGLFAYALVAWVDDPTSDAGCDDPRMNCTTAGTSPAGFDNHNPSAQESE